MASQAPAKQQQVTVKSLFSRDTVKNKFEEMLGKKTQGFVSSVLQIVSNNKLLAKADPMTILNAAATAASLDLPINQSLGRAWIVPYGNAAQFQIGYKGFVELAQRTGQYESINAISVHANQFESFNYLTEELKGNFGIPGDGNVVGYAAHFKLLNGFTKTVYWTKEEVVAHGKRFSKSFGNGPWKTDFDAMAKKTVLKNALHNWGILSIEMQTAVLADQAVQKNEGEYSYDDNNGIDIEAIDVDKETERVRKHIEAANTVEELEQVATVVNEYGLEDEYDNKHLTLSNV